MSWRQKHGELIEFCALTMGPPIIVGMFTNSGVAISFAALGGMLIWVARHA